MADNSRSDLSRLQGMSVLLAEDNATKQLVATQMLENLGATVDVAATPIVWVDLTGPQGPVSQGDPTTEITDRSHSPVTVTSVTIDDQGLRSLSPLAVSVGVGGIRLADDANASVTSENGALVAATSNDFPDAVARVMSSADLRHYLRGDGTASNGDNGRLDLDLTFSPALDDTTRANLGNLLTIGGELVLEAKAEFRLNVYKYIELALFSDVGNVWFLPSSEVNFVGTGEAKLTPSTLFQVGWDAGVGVRLDFDFFIFRVDVAQQLYAPDLQGFVVKSFPRDLGGNRYQINFGIGYPF